MPGKEKSLDGWIRLSPKERTYSLILEVAKQLKKLEPLSERLGSEENRGWALENQLVSELGRGKGKDEALHLPSWLLSFDLFSFVFLVIPLSFLARGCTGEVGMAVAQHNIADTSFVPSFVIICLAITSPHLGALRGLPV
jgi:hypothetical protein